MIGKLFKRVCFFIFLDSNLDILFFINVLAIFLILLITNAFNFLFLAGIWDGWYAPPQVSKDEGYFHSQSVIDCGEKPANVSKCFKAPNFCLFNITQDPCEYHDLSQKYPEIFNLMVARLQIYEDGMVPAKRNETVDPQVNPKLYNGVWQPWVKLP